MIKVLDLFSGTQSVKKALTEKFKIKKWVINGLKNKAYIGFKELDSVGNGVNPIVEYIGVDIYSPEDENLILDLSEDNIVKKIVKELGNWTPDFIWNSPICNKFSTACAYKGGNLFFEKVGLDEIKIRTKWEDKNNKAYPYEKCKENSKRYIEESKLALKLHTNGKKIIDYFNVPFAIENPRRAMSKYLYKEYENNFTSYCMYGFKYEKPTTIYSNKKINLKICNHKPKREFHTIMLSGNKKDYTNGRKNMSSYSQRSSVPPKLIVSILDQLLYVKA